MLLGAQHIKLSCSASQKNFDYNTHHNMQISFNKKIIELGG